MDWPEIKCVEEVSLGAQVDLEKRTVKTLAGDGTKAEGDYVGGQRGSAQRLNSPWDLTFDQQVRRLPEAR